jgi:hypothetical protein
MSIEHYFPILKGKAGEFRALRELTAAVRDHITPLIDVARVPVVDRPKPLELHLNKTINGVAKSWGSGRPIFIDLFDLDLKARLDGGEHPVRYTIGRLQALGVEAIPVVGLDRDKHYEEAVRESCAKVDSVVIRLLAEDLEAAGTLESEVTRLLKAAKVPDDRAQILFDLRSLRDLDITRYSALVIRAIRALPKAREYSSMIVAGSGVPQSLAEAVQADSLGRIPRRELELWRRLRSTPGIARRPSFGDYGVVHPDNLDLNPKAITLAASIRYTSADALVVVRGKAFKSHPDGYGQYHSLSSIIVALPDFRGAGFSWGDRRLAECAAGTWGPGNKTSWVSIATSHHLAHVDEQLGRAA